MFKGQLGPFGGIRIYEDPNMVEMVFADIEVRLTFRQRFIDPLLHPVTMPFEPWVRTRIVTHVSPRPSRKIYQTLDGFIMHPMIADEVRRAVDAGRPLLNIFKEAF